jgi:hypothetical protein
MMDLSRGRFSAFLADVSSHALMHSISQFGQFSELGPRKGTKLRKYF